MNIEGLATCQRSCCDTPFLLGYRTWTTTLDGFTVDLHPLTDLFQQSQSGIRKATVSARADVQQKVGVHRDGLGKGTHKLRRCLVVTVGNTVAPGVVHRLTHLKRQFVTDHLPLGITGGVLPRKIPLEHLEVLTLNRLDMMIVSYEASRIH